MSSSENFEHDYAKLVGVRLRALRQHKGLSLSAAAGASQGGFGAAALGAYERGTRVISVPRLRLLAQLYDVPLEELLPDGHAGALSSPEQTTRASSLRLSIDALRKSTSVEAVALRNFIDRVRVERHDYDGRVFTIRMDDLRVLGAALGRDEHEMLERLEDLKLLIRRG